MDILDILDFPGTMNHPDFPGIPNSKPLRLFQAYCILNKNKHPGINKRTCHNEYPGYDIHSRCTAKYGDRNNISGILKKQR
jgi:hypothetical protein